MSKLCRFPFRSHGGKDDAFESRFDEEEPDSDEEGTTTVGDGRYTFGRVVRPGTGNLPA